MGNDESGHQTTPESFWWCSRGGFGLLSSRAQVVVFLSHMLVMHYKIHKLCHMISFV